MIETSAYWSYFLLRILNQSHITHHTIYNSSIQGYSVLHLGATLMYSSTYHTLLTFCKNASPFNQNVKITVYSEFTMENMYWLSIRCQHGLPYRFKIVHMNAFVVMIPDCQVNGSPAGRTEFC